MYLVVSKKKYPSWVWGWDRKICPSQSLIVITRQASSCQSVLLRTDFSIPSSNSWCILILTDTCTWSAFFQTVSEYDQEIQQSQTADKPVASWGRATQQSLQTHYLGYLTTSVDHFWGFITYFLQLCVSTIPTKFLFLQKLLPSSEHIQCCWRHSTNLHCQ